MPIFDRAETSISIHVPREGHDEDKTSLIAAINISIHVPREGHDTITEVQDGWGKLFQSTCPARGTTGDLAEHIARCGHFNPRAPRGARHIYFQ